MVAQVLAPQKPHNKTFTPAGSLVAVHVHRVTEMVTQGGIHVPDNQADNWESPTAVIVAVGPKCEWAKEGMIVLFHPSQPAMVVRHKGNHLVVLLEENIVGVVDPDPE